MRQLIVTGDDFGLALPVNEAIERAHRDGILTSASLMVGAGAAADAVARARALPDLRVGLHLVVAEGRPCLPPAQIPQLVNDDGQLPADLVRSGVRFFFLASARAQLQSEIRAQFDAFRATGLRLDHVNAHNHMHLHPTVASAILAIGPEYGLRAVRIPAEASGSGLLTPWLALLRRRLRRAGVTCNDQVLGQSHTGRMNEATVLRLLDTMPDGVTEMYFHPATRRCPEIDRGMPDYQHEQELAALTSARVRDALEAMQLSPTSYGEL